MPHEHLTDRELLAGWRSGDRDLGGALYQRHFAAISSFFRRNVYDRSQIDVLTQETFVALLESRTEIEHVQGWLFRTAFFKFTRYLRGRRGEPVLDEEVTLTDTERPAADYVPDPEYVEAQREDKRLLMRAIRRLAPKYQWVLELSYWEDKTALEVAEILGLPEGTVRSRLRLAREALDARLAELATSADALRESTMSTAAWQRKVQSEIQGRGRGH